MDKTALHTVRERLQQKINGCIELDMPLEKWAFIQALKFVDEAMDLERQQIESSYERGRVDAMIIENGLESKFQSGSDYYQSKYTEKEQ